MKTALSRARILMRDKAIHPRLIGTDAVQLTSFNITGN